jgi:hypothetical protein
MGPHVVNVLTEWLLDRLTKLWIKAGIVLSSFSWVWQPETRRG